MGSEKIEAVMELLEVGDLLEAAEPSKKIRQSLQKALNKAGYSKNFQKYADDGVIGLLTMTDICDFCEDHPAELKNLGPSFTKQLINAGFGDELATIVQTDSDLQCRLRDEVDDILDGRSLEELSKPELEVVQAKWSMLGLYDKKVDGIIGEGSRAAYAAHMACADGEAPAGPAPVEEQTVPTAAASDSTQQEIPATDQPVVGPDSSLYKNFNEQVMNPAPPAPAEATNGYGVPLSLIEQAWENVENGTKTERPSAQLVSNTSQKRLLVIDLGHGGLNKTGYKKLAKGLDIDLSSGDTGADRGAVSPHNGLRETDPGDAVGAELARLIHEKYGDEYDVVFTRNPGEVFNEHYNWKKSITARGRFGNEVGAGYQHVRYLSFHSNSIDNKSSHGAIAFAASKSNGDGVVDTGRPAVDKQSVVFRDFIAQKFSLSPGERTGKSTFDAGMLTSFDCAAGNTSNQVACLIELGFLSNAKDSQSLKEIVDNPNPAAESLMEAIIAYDRSVGLTPAIQPQPEVRIARAETTEPTKPAGTRVTYGAPF